VSKLREFVIERTHTNATKSVDPALFPIAVKVYPDHERRQEGYTCLSCDIVYRVAVDSVREIYRRTGREITPRAEMDTCVCPCMGHFADEGGGK
jgi:hypothetical protein